MLIDSGATRHLGALGINYLVGTIQVNMGCDFKILSKQGQLILIVILKTTTKSPDTILFKKLCYQRWCLRGAKGATIPPSGNLSPLVGRNLTICREISLMITHLYIEQTMSSCY